MDEAQADTIPPRPPWAGWVYLLAVAGGVIGMLAAVYEEIVHGSWLAMVLVGPAIEEVCKPLIVIILLEKRAYWFASRAQVIICAVLAALVFATLENLTYVHVYHPDGGAGFVLWRYAVCTSLHVLASTVFAVGLGKMWRHIRRTGAGFDIDYIFRYYVAAVIIHAAYNSTVLVLYWLGTLRF